MKHYEYEISLFVEDELPPDKKEELFLHLSSCKKCSKALKDYQKIKNNISDFYKTLPSGNINLTPVQIKKSFTRRVKPWKILIPVSISILIFTAITFFMKPGLHPEINPVNNVKKEVSKTAISNEKINSNTNLKNKEEMNRVLIDCLNIIDFNKVINNTIFFKEGVDRELKNAGYYYEFEEFNKAINIDIYNNYN